MCRICMKKDIPIGNIFIESERLERTRVPRKQSLPNCTQHGDRRACVR